MFPKRTCPDGLLWDPHTLSGLALLLSEGSSVQLHVWACAAQAFCSPADPSVTEYDNQLSYVFSMWEYQNKLTFNFSFLKEKHTNTFRDYCFKAYYKNKEMVWSPNSLTASPSVPRGSR